MKGNWLLNLGILTSLAFYGCRGADHEAPADESALNALKSDMVPERSRDEIISYAKTGVGSPYVWGGNRWDTSDRERLGADCSGFSLRAWALPTVADPTAPVERLGTTSTLYHSRTHWDKVSKESAQPGDLFVYRSEDDSNGHVYIFNGYDEKGRVKTIEARGTAYGIVNHVRNGSSGYIAIQRKKLSDAPASTNGGTGNQPVKESGKEDSAKVEQKTPTENTNSTGQYEMQVMASTLNLRSGPGMNFPIIKELKRGEKVIGLDKKGNWHNVKYGENIGWMSEGSDGSYLKKTSSKAKAEVSQPDEESFSEDEE